MRLCTPFFVPHIGGMERALYRMMVALSRRAWNVTIDTSELTPHGNVDLDVTRVGATLEDWAGSLHGRLSSADAAHTTLLFASLGPGTGQQQLLAGSDFRERGGYTVWRTPTADHAYRNLAANGDGPTKAFDVIVANSQASALMTQKVVPRVPVTVVPNLLLDEELKEHDAAILRPRSADLSWAGRVEPRKQPRLVSALLNRAARSGLTVLVQPVPSYGNRALFDEFCRSLDPRIRIHQPTVGMHPDIAAATVFLHLSTREGSPNSLLEASSRGQGILASDIPECRELLSRYEDVGWITASDQFEGKLQILLSRPDSVRCRSVAAQRIRDNCNESAIAALWSTALDRGCDRD